MDNPSTALRTGPSTSLKTSLPRSLIRNFCIIAHVDHGKSTLADRFLEITGSVSKSGHAEQLLDNHPISRARGITIRLAPVTMHYSLIRNSQLDNYQLNLIDTPGHVDFSYEVERTLSACEGAILLVDATQGIQAQTLSHFQKAQKLGLTIIPVINKIDMPNARTAETEKDLHELFNSQPRNSEVPSENEGLDNSQFPILKVSAKTGEGVQGLLEEVIRKVPPPAGNPDGPARALVFSSQFAAQKGVTAFVRVFDGKLEGRGKIRFLAAGLEAAVLDLGHFSPAMLPTEALGTGEVGYLTTNLKDPSLVRVGDTITTENSQFAIPRQARDYPERSRRTIHNSQLIPLPGYREIKPMVFISLFPVDQNDYALLEDALEKLKLNDAALAFSPMGSKVLGRGFRAGFLGHLHAEVSRERLETDFGLNVLATTPTVEYRIRNSQSLDKLGIILSETEGQFAIRNYEEPWVLATVILPQNYVGPIMSLSKDHRGILKNMVYHGNNVTLTYEIPLGEIITDFFDELKSRTSGYGSLDYEFLDYRPFDAVTLEILINHEAVDAFSQILPKEKAESYGRFLVERLKEAIPRQQIPIIIQAAIDNQIIARADIAAYRKDVTAKLYGGDRTRRDKLLEAQRKGKKKMRQIGRVQIPGDTFLKIFKT